MTKQHKRSRKPSHKEYADFMKTFFGIEVDADALANIAPELL